MWTKIPVDPDADTAREWAVQELSQREYTDDGENWLDALWRWFSELFNGIGNAGNGLGIAGVVVLVILGVGLVALLVWLVVGPMLRSRRADADEGLFAGDSRGSKEMLADADAAAGALDWHAALLNMYRATIRSLGERGVIRTDAGITAHEAAVTAGATFPSVALQIAADADAFDGARYGNLVATREHFEHARQTHRILASATVAIRSST